jgi:hypothetical protein
MVGMLMDRLTMPVMLPIKLKRPTTMSKMGAKSTLPASRQESPGDDDLYDDGERPESAHEYSLSSMRAGGENSDSEHTAEKGYRSDRCAQYGQETRPDDTVDQAII